MAARRSVTVSDISLLFEVVGTEAIGVEGDSVFCSLSDGLANLSIPFFFTTRGELSRVLVLLITGIEPVSYFGFCTSSLAVAGKAFGEHASAFISIPGSTFVSGVGSG